MFAHRTPPPPPWPFSLILLAGKNCFQSCVVRVEPLHQEGENREGAFSSFYRSCSCRSRCRHARANRVESFESGRVENKDGGLHCETKSRLPTLASLMLSLSLYVISSVLVLSQCSVHCKPPLYFVIVVSAAGRASLEARTPRRSVTRQTTLLSVCQGESGRGRQCTLSGNM